MQALDIVYSQLSGTLQSHREGASVNTMQSGFGAKAGLIAAALARRGITGPRDCLTGMFGYYSLYEGGNYHPSILLGDLGTRYEVLNISQKPYPCGRLTHGAVELALALHREGVVRVDDIVQVTVAVSAFVQQLVGRPHNPQHENPLDARLSLPFTVATALLRGTMEISDAEGAALRDPAIQQLAQHVTVLVDPDLAPSNALRRNVWRSLEARGSGLSGASTYSRGHRAEPYPGTTRLRSSGPAGVMPTPPSRKVRPGKSSHVLPGSNRKTTSALLFACCNRVKSGVLRRSPGILCT